MTEKLLLEREGSRIALPERSGDKYKVRIIGWEPGSDVSEGSSGDYPVSMLKEDVPAAFPKGTRMKANHDGLCEAGGDIRRIMAKTVDEPWAEEDGMYTYMVPSKEHEGFLEQYADVIGLSISAAGEYQYVENEDGDMEVARSERGAPIIKHLYSMEESPYNSIDFVEAPGADGRIVAKVVQEAQAAMLNMNLREAAVFARDTIKPPREDSVAVPPQDIKEGNSMEKEEVTQIANEAANTAVAKALEALKPAEPTEDATNIETVAEAMIEAGLSKESREAVYERLNRGEKVAEAIAKEKAREDAIEARVKAQVESSAPAPASFGYTLDESDDKPTAREGVVSDDEFYGILEAK